MKRQVREGQGDMLHGAGVGSKEGREEWCKKGTRRIRSEWENTGRIKKVATESGKEGSKKKRARMREQALLGSFVAVTMKKSSEASDLLCGPSLCSGISVKELLAFSLGPGW